MSNMMVQQPNNGVELVALGTFENQIHDCRSCIIEAHRQNQINALPDTIGGQVKITGNTVTRTGKGRSPDPWASGLRSALAKGRIQHPVTQRKLVHEVFTWPLMANPAKPQEKTVMLVPVFFRIWTRLPASSLEDSTYPR